METGWSVRGEGLKLTSRRIRANIEKQWSKNRERLKRTGRRIGAYM